MIAEITPFAGADLAPRPAASDDGLRAAAQALERAFLNEFLKSAGVGRTPAFSGGGIGEEQFASFLREIQAGQISEAGGIGLAENIFRSLSRGSEQ